MDGSQHHPHTQLHPLHPGNSSVNAAFMQQPQAWRGGGSQSAGFGGGGALPGPQQGQGQQGAQQGAAPAMGVGVARGPGSESGVGPTGLGAMPSG